MGNANISGKIETFIVCNVGSRVHILYERMKDYFIESYEKSSNL